MPTPDRVWSAWTTWAFGTPALGLNPHVGTRLDNVLFASSRVAQGFALAIAVGVPVGILIGRSRLVADAVDPTIQWMRPIPITAWLSATRTDRILSVSRQRAASAYGDAARWRETIGRLPFERLCEPGEVADVVALLASPRAGYVSGTVVDIDAGASSF